MAERLFCEVATDYTYITIVMRFRKPWLRVKSVNFDFSTKSSSTDHNKWNKPTTKSLAYIGSEKSLAELGVPKNKLFHFFAVFTLPKSLLFTVSHGLCKIINTDYNELNKPNPKSLAHIGSEKSLAELEVPEN